MINTVDYSDLSALIGVDGQSFYNIGIDETSICQFDSSHVLVIFTDTTNHYLYLDILYFDSNYIFTPISRTLIKNGNTFIKPVIKKLDDYNFAVTILHNFTGDVSDYTYHLYLLKINIDTYYTPHIISDIRILHDVIYYYKNEVYGFDVINASTIVISFGRTYGVNFYQTYVYNIDGTELATIFFDDSFDNYDYEFNFKIASLGGGYFLVVCSDNVSADIGSDPKKSYVASFYFDSSNNTLIRYTTAIMDFSIDGIDIIKIDSTKALLIYSCVENTNVYTKARVISIDVNHNPVLNPAYNIVSNLYTGINKLVNIDGTNFGIAYGIFVQNNIGYFSIISISGTTISSVIDSSYGISPYQPNIQLWNFGIISLGNNHLTIACSGIKETDNSWDPFYGFINTLHFYESTPSNVPNVNLFTSSNFQKAKKVYIYTGNNWHLAKKVSVLIEGNMKTISVSEDPITVSLDSTSHNWPANYYGSGNAITVNVTLSSDDTIYVADIPSWLTVSIDQSTNQIIMYPNSANTGAIRTAILTVTAGANSNSVSFTASQDEAATSTSPI